MEYERHFTIDEANQMIPWLEEQLLGVVSVMENLEDLERNLDNILQKVRSNGHSNSHSKTKKDMAENRKQTDNSTEKLRLFAEGIQDLGIILRDPIQGLVDFPALNDGREIYLCWISGEDRIKFWHEITTGFSGRQPLM